VTKWFVLGGFPFIPLGTYRVMQVARAQPPRYAMAAAEWDWKQVFFHYAVAYGSFPLLVLIFGLAGAR
jgi:hypothetical protein